MLDKTKGLKEMSSKKLKKLSAEDKLKLAKKYKLKKEDLISMLRNIYVSRKLDDAEITMKKQSKAFFQISGAGHEGVLTAAAFAMKPRYDWFIPYYRDRALCTGLGVTPYEMLCQANGNIGDTASHGRQMPAHWGNVKLNIVNKSSCTGTQFLQACGVAEAGEYLNSLDAQGDDVGTDNFKDDEVVYTSCGDGTTSQGEFWEGLTTACVNKLPVLFHVEDNGYAISTPTFVQTPGGSISKAMDEFPGLKVLECDGNCPIESYATFVEAVKHIRAKKGPVLVHSHVTRPYSHSLSDDQSMYRTKEELAEEKVIDVFNSYPKTLIETGIMTESEVKELLDEVSKEVRQAMNDAIATEWPKPEDSLKHIFSEDVDITSSEFDTTPTLEGKDDIPMAGAINAVLKREFASNPLLRMFGEDVADFSQLEKLDNPDLSGKGGVFKVSSGVQRASKEGQVFNSPLAEANIIGRAIGMAMRGIKPVVEIQFFDYIWTAYMQLKNEMATTRYRSGGDFKCPMVVRVPIGGYLRGGSIYHSQCGESLFTHVPGICVAYPSNAADAAGLLRTAIRADDPVMFLEHKHLYYQGYNRTADVGEEYMIPFGKARVAREGADATIVAWGALVQKSIEAAKRVESELGVKIEILDARTLVPFDMDAVKKSLEKTNRLLICHEETKTSGFAGEIAARVNEECFESLDAPILRVTARDSYVAYCPTSEDYILPQIDDVYDQLKKLLSF
ncbi:putative pyruvate (oxoisovalerate) Dehydrogenase, alpha-beta fusion [Halobacteriovorax marinus SJ]|uniref:Pyruvate (Oxoisovalerate) Dehydrogenase, alpha-beta fusion n=1 Tax=Halobacteriovorax marinus (strain ATCC BAA-682 / DSM 15412 / SJ) TaxID=862908 RepID=E1WZZ6_HALMS|nr:dehydrogenase E1 component subunit alpha/beta [Halobacteriovorax marinus]CBW27932.1 putative pyruvate (oxoisovalerate) Dehydrogenase, alpha-beta fusion [Halobacteriovorax marinus SJ]